MYNAFICTYVTWTLLRLAPSECAQTAYLCGHVAFMSNAESGVSRLKMVARLMVDRRVVLATSLYGLVGLLQVMMNEVLCESKAHTCMAWVHYRTHTYMYVYWLHTSVCVLSCRQLFPLLIVNDQAHGGYKFDDNEIAVMITLAAGGQILFQVLFSHRACLPLSLSLTSPRLL